MPFDFKKEYKEFYMPKNKPEIVNVPKANYIAVRGKRQPNRPDVADFIKAFSRNNSTDYEYHQKNNAP